MILQFFHPWLRFFTFLASMLIVGILWVALLFMDGKD